MFAINLLHHKNGILTRHFVVVHESNMSKLDEYGKPIYRPDGKVLKGPNYKEPYLQDLIIE